MLRFYFLIGFLLFNVLGHAQSKEFFGLLTLSHPKSELSYKVICTITNGRLQGYSISNIGTPTETRATVTGTLKNKKIYIKEVKVTQSKDASTDFCLLEIYGTVVEKNGKETFTGTFKGYTNGNKEKLCGSGTVAMSNITYRPPTITPSQNNSKPHNNMVQPIKDTFSKPSVEQRPPQPIVIPSNNSSNIVSLKNNYKATVQARNGNITLSVWDDNEIDGDIISLYPNGRLILSNYRLTDKPYKIPINIKEDAIVKIVSISVGAKPPNTARITANNGQEDKSYKLDLENQQSASILIKY